MSDLEKLICAVENEIGPGWGWLLRSDENTGYFANITENRDLRIGEKTCAFRANSMDGALLGALSIWRSR